MEFNKQTVLKEGDCLIWDSMRPGSYKPDTFVNMVCKTEYGESLEIDIYEDKVQFTNGSNVFIQEFQFSNQYIFRKLAFIFLQCGIIAK